MDKLGSIAKKCNHQKKEKLTFAIHKKNGLLIPDSLGVGKSGHHRAAKRITSVGRKIRTSATESMYINL